MQIVQIVPRLPPAIDGVGDYAYLLARQLRAAHDIHAQFVVCDTSWRNAEMLKSESGKRKAEMELDGFKVFQLKERSAAELLRALSSPEMPQTALLQYVGYGYEKRGCPVWLTRALREWLDQRPDGRGQKAEIGHPSSGLRRLVTMFHELYAFGPPWRSSFWTSPLQRWTAQALARMRGHCLTNRAASAHWLASGSRRPINAIPVLPVFSNVGEPGSPAPLSSRKPQMLIYGGASRLPGDFRPAEKAIGAVCGRLGIEHLIVFGKKTGKLAPAGLRVENVGALSPANASKWMMESRAGYLDYFDGYLAKSGIFAAYCAHGLVPVLLRDSHSEADGLESGKHFWVASAPPLETGIAAQQDVADRAHKWYARHSVAATARAFADKLKSHVDLLVEE